MYIYIYLYVQRERERQKYIHTYKIIKNISKHMEKHVYYIYTYIYICREAYSKRAKLDLNKKAGGGLEGRAQRLPPKQNNSTCFHAVVTVV